MPLHEIDMKEVGRSIQLVGAVYADNERAFLVMLPGEDASRPHRPVTLDHEEWKDFLRQTDLVEVEALVAGAGPNGEAGRAIVRKASRQVSQNVSWNVFRRDGFRCRYCGVEDQPLTVDHLVTWESGGPSIEENLVAACRRCNNTRGETPFAEWLASPYYKRVSQGLAYTERFANEAIIARLGSIPVTPLKDGKKRSRR